jgi:hypothetical protein
MKTQLVKRSDRIWWIAFLSVAIGGLVMRWLTIDRNTPGIGAFVYIGLLGVLFIVIALPVSFIAAFAWHHWRQQIVDLGFRFARAIRALRNRFAMKTVSEETRVRYAVVVIVAVLTFAFSVASGRLPPWHVWVSAVVCSSLLAWKLFAWMIDALRLEALIEKRDATLQREAHHSATSQLNTLVGFTVSDSNAKKFASDDRNFRARLRACRLQIKQ